jgi:glycosyltransferase involved in cell wall biosynthesis
MRPDLTVAVSLFANDGGRSGIGRYLKEVSSALVAADPRVAWRFFIAKGDLPVFAGIAPPDGDRVRWIAVFDAWNSPAISPLWHAAAFPFLAARSGADVIYLPAGNRRLVPFSSLPTVAVVHDLSSFHVQAKYDPLRMLYIKRVMPWLIRRSSRVIAISTSSADDVVQLAGYPRERVTIIGNGFDRRVFAPRPAEESRRALTALGRTLPERFLLYVSRLEHPGKNHVGLLRAYRKLLDRRPDFPFDLVFAGSRWNGAEAIDAAIEELGLGERVHLLGFVQDAELPHLYSAARAMVFPSLFEGFGIPILEAQASALPVAASNVSSIPEVVGDGGLLFDPADPASVADAIERVALDEALREELVRKGLLNAARFTWENTAKRTLEVLREAAAPRLARLGRGPV